MPLFQCADEPQPKIPDHSSSGTTSSIHTTTTHEISTTVSRLMDAIVPPALENIREAEQSSHSHPLDSSTFGGTYEEQVDGEVRTISLGHVLYGKIRDSFVVAPPTLDFQRQFKSSLKPPTQVGVDGDGNLITSFPFNMKGARTSAVLRLAKTTRRRSLSLSQRVTSSCNTTSIVYKFSESSEETSAVTSTTTASVLDEIHPDGKKCEQCTDGSGSDTSEMSTGSDDTKSLSIIPDTEDEGSVVNVNDAPASPVFGVKGPSSFSTEYPEDSSNAFSSQGLVEVDKLGSSLGDCSEDLFSNADQREQVIPMETDEAHEKTETETFSENTLVENAEDTEMTNLEGSKKRHIVDPTTHLPLKKRLRSHEGNQDNNTYPDHCPFKTKSNTSTGVKITNSGDYVHENLPVVTFNDLKDLLIGTGEEQIKTAFDQSSCSEAAADKETLMKKSLTVSVNDSKDVLIGTGSETSCVKVTNSGEYVDENLPVVTFNDLKDLLIDTGEEQIKNTFNQSSCSEAAADKETFMKKSLTVTVADSKDVRTENGSEHSDTTFNQSSCSEGADDIITFRKKHFIVQDLGVGEMVVEGKSKIHIHVNSKSEFRSLLQRLIVKIGENKGWEVVLENIPDVKIPNIDNLLNQSQNGVVMYSDIALDPLLKTQSGDIGSKAAHGSMNIDCVTSGEQQPNLYSPDSNVESKIVSDGKKNTNEG